MSEKAYRNLKLFLTGSGGWTGYNWYLLLESLGIEYELGDCCYPFSLGRKGVLKIPKGDSLQFIRWSKEIIERKGFNLLILVDEEVWNLSLCSSLSQKMLEKVWVPIGREFLKKFVDKLNLQKTLEVLGLPYINSERLDKVEYWKEEYIIKPRLGRGGREVLRFPCKEISLIKRLVGNPKEYLIQDFIKEGSMKAFDVFVCKGRIFIWERKVLIGDLGRARVFEFSTDVEKSILEKLEILVEAVIKTVKNNCWIMSIDTIDTPSGLFIIEINPRPSVYLPIVLNSEPILKEFFLVFLKKEEFLKKISIRRFFNLQYQNIEG
jgi:predicted ATP-grasp superfamily ATP-dependent carboligase